MNYNVNLLFVLTKDPMMSLVTEASLGRQMIKREVNEHQQYLLFDTDFIDTVIDYFLLKPEIKSAHLILLETKDLVQFKAILNYHKGEKYEYLSRKTTIVFLESDSELNDYLAVADLASVVIVMDIDKVIEIDVEQDEIKTNQETILFSTAQTIIVQMTHRKRSKILRESIQTMKKPEATAWWCYYESNFLYHKNILLEIEEMGRILDDHFLMDTRAIQKYGKVRMLHRLYKEKLVKSPHPKWPQNHVKYRQIIEDKTRENQGHQLMEKLYEDRILPHFATPWGANTLFYSYFVLKLNARDGERDWKQINETDEHIINEAREFIKQYELLYYNAPTALKNMLERVSASSKAFRTEVRKTMMVIEEKGALSKRAVKMVKLIEKKLWFDDPITRSARGDIKPRRDSAWEMMVVPDNINEDAIEGIVVEPLVVKIYNSELLKGLLSPRDRNARTILRSQDALKNREPFNRIRIVRQENIQEIQGWFLEDRPGTQILIITETQLRELIPYSCLWIRNKIKKIHVFLMKAIYDLKFQEKLISLFPIWTPPNIVVYFGSTNLELYLTNYIRQRKVATFQKMNLRPEMWLFNQSVYLYGKHFPLLYDRNGPLIEPKPETSSSLDSELTPFEVVKAMSTNEMAPLPFVERYRKEGLTIQETLEYKRGQESIFDWYQLSGYQMSMFDVKNLYKFLRRLTPWIRLPEKEEDVDGFLIPALRLIEYFVAHTTGHYKSRRAWMNISALCDIIKKESKSAEVVGLCKRIQQSISRWLLSRVNESGIRFRSDPNVLKLGKPISRVELIKKAALYFQNIHVVLHILRRNVGNTLAEDCFTPILNTWYILYSHHEPVPGDLYSQRIRDLIETVRRTKNRLETKDVIGRKENMFEWA